jgi:hypothetical protein
VYYRDITLDNLPPLVANHSLSTVTIANEYTNVNVDPKIIAYCYRVARRVVRFTASQ